MSITGLLLISSANSSAAAAGGSAAIRSLATRSLALAKAQLCETLYVYLPGTGNLNQSGTGTSSASPSAPGPSCSSNTNNLVSSLSQFTTSFYSAGSKICPDIDIRLLIRSLLPPAPATSTARTLNKPVDYVFVQEQLSVSEMNQLISQFSVSDPPNIQIIPNEKVQFCTGSEVPNMAGSSTSNNMHDIVALGGTFDGLHNGHRMLLTEAVIRCNKEIIVGVTDESMIKNKVLKDLILPTPTRIQIVQDFLSDIGPGLIHRVVPISDPFGPTIVEKDIDLIIVSEETLRGAQKINEIRNEKGFSPLQIHTIQLFQESSRQSEHEDSKISSSSRRIRILGTRLKPPLKTPSSPYIIGLTGGIASGKSNICKYLAEHGNIPIVDCDKLGHAAYKYGTTCFTQIVDTFGTDILNPATTSSDAQCQCQPEINRRALGSKVFGKPDELKKLTDIVWPEIKRLALEQIQKFAQDGSGIVILDAAVLFEAGWDNMCHDVWVTFISREEAIQRIQNRDNLSPEDAERRIDSQLSNRERIAKATFVFCSHWEYEFTQGQVEKALSTVQQELDSSKTQK